MQNHYNYTFDAITNTYNFITKNCILYRVAFIVDETFSVISNENIPNVFQLVVEKANEEIEPFDSFVSRTIENIIEAFFRNIENSLVYVCSDNDDKALKRFKIFDRWYKNSQYKNSVEKYDNLITVSFNNKKPQLIYTSLLFHKDNANYKKLINIYEQIEQVLNSEK